MCGIAGLPTTQLNQSSAATAIAAMQEALTHLSQDGDGESGAQPLRLAEQQGVA